MTDAPVTMAEFDQFKVEMFGRMRFLLNSIAMVESRQNDLICSRANIFSVNWGYEEPATCKDFSSVLKESLPYHEWGCGQCDHLCNHSDAPPLSSAVLHLSCEKGHRIMCFVARTSQGAEQ